MEYNAQGYYFVWWVHWKVKINSLSLSLNLKFKDMGYSKGKGCKSCKVGTVIRPQSK